MVKMSSSSFILLAIIACPLLCLALYDSSDDVVILTPANWEHEINKKGKDTVWLIEFFAPWCGHCKALTPEFKKAATALKGIVNVGAVDCDAHGSLAQKFAIKGFPTLKFFINGEKTTRDYQGPRSASGMVDESFKQLRSLVNSRLSGGSGGSSRDSGSSSADDVVELTDSNFNELVLNDKKNDWLVMFFAPWCGHCKSLKPHYAKVATEFKDRKGIKVGQLDATVHQVIASRYNIKGYPTLKYFKKDSKDPEDYEGGRTAEDMINFIEDRVSADPPPLIELTNDKQFQEVCSGSSLCIISFLPSIYDCQSACRNEYLDMLKKVGEKFKRQRNWSYLWLEGASQLDLEKEMEVGGFGYPAMFALNLKKQMGTSLKGSFGLNGISEFLRDLSYGRIKSGIQLKKIPKVSTMEPWDGKDAFLPVEEVDDLDNDAGQDADDLKEKQEL